MTSLLEMESMVVPIILLILKNYCSAYGYKMFVFYTTERDVVHEYTVLPIPGRIRKECHASNVWRA
jgi:hypothetical protein